MGTKKLKILLVCSGGGHFEQMMKLREFYEEYEYEFVLPKHKVAEASNLQSAVVYAFPDINEGRGIRYPWLLLYSFLRALWLVIIIRPKLIVSTGAGVAFPFFAVAWIVRIPSIYIESFARIRAPSRSGRACYRFASVFFVQHKELLNAYPKAKFSGCLYENL